MFGGAFNPPTNAHIELAHYACTKTHKDCVVFVPSQMNYIENDQHKSFAFDNQTRVSMLQKIADDYDWMKVSDYEVNVSKQPRSYTTLQYLEKQGYHCSLLFGSDKLTELEYGWLHVDEIAHEFGMVCMERNHEDVKAIIESDAYLKQLQPYIQIVHTPDTWQNVSSSQVRKLFIEEKYHEIDALIPSQLNGLRGYRKGESQ